MAKKVDYKVKAKVTRDPSGGAAQLSIDYETKEEVKKVEVELEGPDILRMSKEISDFNHKEMEMAKRSLFIGEDERDVEIKIRVLEG